MPENINEQKKKSSLSGLEKAAVVILSLPPNVAAKVLKQLKDYEIEKLTTNKFAILDKQSKQLDENLARLDNDRKKTNQERDALVIKNNQLKSDFEKTKNELNVVKEKVKRKIDSIKNILSSK